MVLGTSAAFAQTDIVKSVKKAKTFADAVQAAQGVEALPESDQNKVYDAMLKLAAKEFEADKKNYDAARTFLGCVTNYAQKNPKGAMKYFMQMDQARQTLLDPGQEGLNAQDYQKVYDNLHYYVDAANVMYEGDLKKDPGVPQITYFVAVAASQLGKDKEAIHYAQPALNDSVYGGAAMSIKLAALKKAVKNHNDSIEFISEVKDLYGKYPVGSANDVVLQEVVVFILFIDMFIREIIFRYNNDDRVEPLFNSQSVKKRHLFIPQLRHLRDESDSYCFARLDR